MVPNHRHKQIGGVSSQRALWVPYEREIGIETDTDRIFIGRDSIPGGVPALTSSIENLWRINGTHTKTVGQWVMPDLQIAINNRPVGVVIEAKTNYYIVQVSGLWRNVALPGNVGDKLYLQGTGIAGIPDTGILLGYRVDDGLVLTSGAGLTTAQQEAIESIADKIDGDEAVALVINRLISKGAFEAYNEGGEEKLRIPDSMVEESLEHAGILDPDTGGPGTAFGGRKTILQFAADVSAGTPIYIDDTAQIGVTRSGDIGGFPGTELEFNSSDKIRFVFDRAAELYVGVDAIYQSQNSFTLSFKALSGTSIVVHS